VSASALEALFGLDGRVVAVVGASSGLGAECARAVAKAGAHVGVVARRLDRLESVAGELRTLGAKTCTVAADVTETDAIGAAYDHIEATLGPIDVLINAAGRADPSRAERHSRAKWDRVMALNLTAAFEMSQQIAQRWIDARRPGRIVHISSVIGQVGNPVHRTVGYAASKGGLNSLVRQLAIEWTQHEIAVNAIAPGYFPTEMTIDPAHGDVAPDQAEVMRRFTPMGRLGRPGELETAVLFLTAPATSYVTGVVLPVDGGWTAW
jgi:NAD(P)-dependent dehydrogenase (short-subunit alcohol dehydrogenase family)